MQENDIPAIVTRRLEAGRRLPRAIFMLSKESAGFGISQIRNVGAEPGPHVSPMEFGYRTVVWLGRVMVMVRRKG